MSGKTDSPESATRRWLQFGRIARPVGLACLLLLGYAGWILVPAWLSLLWAMVPRDLQRGVITAFLRSLLVGYGVALAALIVGVVTLGMTLARSRKPLGQRPLLARLLLLACSVMLSLAVLEVATGVWLAWLHRAPAMPAVPPPTVDAPAILPTRFELQAEGNTAGPLRLLVIGESSGRGEPYHPWLSVGQIVGWQLERTVLKRPVQVDIWATGGATLEEMHQKLAGLTYRPDVLILFSGHNEFYGRFAWFRNAPYYLDELPRRVEHSLVDLALRRSPFCRLILETLDRQQVDVVPPQVVTRMLVDRPVCTSQERADLLADYRRRVQAITDYCAAIGTLPVYIVPASNDRDYEPSRSILPAEASAEARAAFAGQFRQARALEAAEPRRALAEYRRLLDQAPGFAETHYRMARLLETAGRFDEGRAHYILAREHDAMPIRCPEDFRQVFREIAARDPRILLVDSSRVLLELCPHRILDDHAYHDAQHPTLLGYIALAQDLLKQLHDRLALGWPESVPTPVIDPDDCARHFGLDTEKWVQVCDRSAMFYKLTAFIRYDPEARETRQREYLQAARQIAAGTAPEEAGITGLGIHPLPAP